MLDTKLSPRKVRKLLVKLQPKPRITKDILAEHSIKVSTPMQQKLHELKQTLPFFERDEHIQHNEKIDSLQVLLSELAKKMETREDRIEHIQSSLSDLRSVIEKIMSYEEEEKKIKLSARARHLQQVEAQLATFEGRLVDASKRYHDEALFPLKQKIAELKEKYLLLKEEEKEQPPAAAAKETELAEELKKKITELELPSQVQEAERIIEEEVQQITEEISAQGVTLDLPDFFVPEEEELSFPSPFPELMKEVVPAEEIPAPPIVRKKMGIIDFAIAEVKKLLSHT